MKSIFFIFIVLLGKSLAKMSLSDLIPICSAKDPNLNDCVVKSANILIPVLSKGIKSYGFPPLDPLHVPKMNLGQNGGPVNLQLELLNTTHLGLSTIKFRSALVNPKSTRWVLNGTLMRYSVEGQYNGNGRILLVPLVGKGHAFLNFSNIGIDFVINGAPKKDKDDVFFVVNRLRVYFKFDKSFVSLSNLFNGNKALGEATNKFLNENSAEVINGLKGTLEDVYSALYTNLLKRIMTNVPFNQLFKDI